jgi:hypothetical protein
MKKKTDTKNLPKNQTDKEQDKELPGYPSYPVSEDIYEAFNEEESIKPDDISKRKSPNKTNAMRHKDLDHEYVTDDLDVPGSELDDAQEAVGSEDEENNYYSLGGDRHKDLEEDKGK